MPSWALHALAGMVRRYVPERDGLFDSVMVPEVNMALLALSNAGLFRIESHGSRRLLGRFVAEGEQVGVFPRQKSPESRGLTLVRVETPESGDSA